MLPDQEGPADDPHEQEAIEFMTRSAISFITQQLLAMPDELRAQMGTTLILSLDHGTPDPEQAKQLIAHLMSTTADIHVTAVLMDLWQLLDDDDDDDQIQVFEG